MSLDTLAASESIGANHLRDYVERFKRLFDKAADVREELKGLTQEAKSEGYDPRALKLIAKREEEDADKADKRLELETVTKTYASAIGTDW